jgi:hypothetical protein
MTILSMYRGDDRTLTITADQSLTGSEITFTARGKRREDSPVLIVKTTDVVTLDAEDTEDLTPGSLWWDVEVVDALGKVHTVAEGRLRVRLDATRLEGS